MTPERWLQIKEIFNSALELKPEERAQFLESACAGRDSLRHQVEALLESHEKAGSFIHKPAVADMAALLSEEQDVSLVGQTISHYEILSKLGEGGMGEVYLAEDVTLRRKVALKLLPAIYTEDKDRLRRFTQEARAASALNHPNILTIYEIGGVADKHFIATEYIDGETLRQRIANARMSTAQALDVAAQIASALSAAHEAGIVHRDIKPENIMIRRDGYVKVLDFGLAKLVELRTPLVNMEEAPTRVPTSTNPGMVLGTVAYMSPEQARGLPVDERTDIFSFGVVLYEMIAGRQPFADKTPLDVLTAILHNEPDALSQHAQDVPPKLEQIVGKALSKEREERYQTVNEMLTDLKELKREMELQAELERTGAPESRERAGVASSVALTVKAEAAQTGADQAHTTSSAEYIVNQVKSHKRAAIVTLIVLALAAAVAAGLIWRFKHSGASKLTEQDTILIADFDNKTGDEVFDGALKQALAIQLEQSPFLNIFSEEQVRETLSFMRRSPDERLTRDVAWEICERRSIKVMLTGSIARLGSHYLIGLEALNAQAGDVIAREQTEAESREQVLKSLGEAATRLRGKLGESLNSIQKFDVPLEQVTTSSLEALRAFSLALERRKKGNELEVIPFLNHAIELDPNFARAYLEMSIVYSNSGQSELSAEYARKAFELREQVSEREKLYISSVYYAKVTREADRAIEVWEVWKRTYPRDFHPYNLLADQYIQIGQFEKAVEEAREAVRLYPDSVIPGTNLGRALICLNRFDEAKEVFERLLARNIDDPFFHRFLYVIAFVHGDAAAMQQQLDWYAGRSNEYVASIWQTETAQFRGQSRKSREFSSRAIDLAMRRNVKEVAALVASRVAVSDAVTGNCQQAREETAKALAILRGDVSLRNGAIALALCGEVRQAQSLADELAKRYPTDTMNNAVWLPVIHAAIEIHNNNPAQAIQSLQTTMPYEGAAQFWPNYLRGQAYLHQHMGAEAAAEFQKTLDHRGWNPVSTLYPLAHLGLARAATLNGDTAAARKAYEDFFALWRDADSDIPILQQAREEYRKLPPD